ncbi:hypothetical protein EJB05_02345, partial [Eragrostis curvula]
MADAPRSCGRRSGGRAGRLRARGCCCSSSAPPPVAVVACRRRRLLLSNAGPTSPAPRGGNDGGESCCAGAARRWNWTWPLLRNPAGPGECWCDAAAGRGRSGRSAGGADAEEECGCDAAAARSAAQSYARAASSAVAMEIFVLFLQIDPCIIL